MPMRMSNDFNDNLCDYLTSFLTCKVVKSVRVLFNRPAIYFPEAK